ncbi:MAG: cytidylyltransferase domain-containing protein [Nostocoides sp.]
MRFLCLVPARGGSKGIPRKNLITVAGRPLVTWTIEQALSAHTDLDVVVSTDDAEIAEVSRSAGADVPFLRPAELALDTTATEPVIEHTLDQLEALGRSYDAVILLQATSPLRLPGTIDRALAQFRDEGADSLVGVVPQAPFIWSLGEPPTAAYDVASRPRRQDLTPHTLRYRETGSLYVTATRVYREQHNRLGGRIGLFIMDEIEGVDIDSDLDLRLTEQTLSRIQQTSTDKSVPAP